MANSAYLQLVQDTLSLLKDPLFPKEPVLVSREEKLFFSERRKEIPQPLPPVVQPPPPAHIKRSPPPAPQPLPVEESIKVAPPCAPVKQEKKAPVPSFDEVKKGIRKMAPTLHLVDEIPDDAQAKRLASSWQEKLPGVEVALLSCEAEASSLLKNLEKAITERLAKAEVVNAVEMEREKKWDLLFLRNRFRLIIASHDVKKHLSLMSFYQENPAQGNLLLNKTPLLILEQASLYHSSSEKKALLWKTICQMLQ
jgi:hypothetical protein